MTNRNTSSNRTESTPVISLSVRRAAAPRSEAHSLLSRATVSLLLVALLVPLVLFGQSRGVQASSAVPTGIAPAASAPAVTAFPAGFVVSSFDWQLPEIFSAGAAAPFGRFGASLADGYRAAAEVIAPPALPAGFSQARLPTFGDRAAVLWSRATATVSTAGSTKQPSADEKAANVADSAPSAATSEDPAAPSGDEAVFAAPAPAPAPIAPPAPYAPGTTRFDFDGDGAADIARFQPATNQWKIKGSSGGAITNTTLGANGAVVAAADYDGDGRTDRAVWNQFTADWTVVRSSNGNTLSVPAFGLNGDKVVSADYDGDGKADFALFRPANGTWYVHRSTTNQYTSVQFGQAGDIPVVGNYDGDAFADYAVFRPSTGTWYVQPGSGAGFFAFQWGTASDIPVPADYDGDGKTDYAVYRPSTGTWYVQPSGSGAPFFGKTWGNYGDQPVAADYDGDGKADIAVWRPTSGIWYIVKSTVPGMTTYAYDQLGVPGDVAVPSAYYKQIGSNALTYDLANARLHPKNATDGATDLYSRNFGWSSGLVSLPGRAGLDAGFGISYNSLVWTKEPISNTVVFDADHSNVAPGFRMGFPTIEPSYYNALTQQYSYLMVTPSGSRVEFRQTAASGVYETADSSYAELTVVAPTATGDVQQAAGVEDLTLVVRTTDGTQMKYVWRAGSYRLAEIKDRNGNLITVVHDQQYGLLQSMTDTLGRVVTVEYDADFAPVAVKQNWQADNGAGAAVARTYATFTYDYQAITPSFAAGINVFGPTGGASVKVLKQIAYPDGRATAFYYNAYGQVYKMRSLASDGHELNSVRTDLESPPTNQLDCPRFATTYQKIENFNNNQETVIHNTWTAGQTFAAGGETLGPTDVVEAWLDGDPNSVHTKTHYYTTGSGWHEGLPLATEDLAGGDRKRWTRMTWTQDELNQNYKVNPRVTESKIGDQSNIKKTIIEYLPVAQNSPIAKFGLVSKAEVRDGNTGALLKAATTDYNLAAAYVSRRIIGLPQEQKLFDENNNLLSKMTYGYDAGDFSDASLAQNLTTVIQHDNAAYGANLIVGRGNATSATQHDIAGQSDPIISRIKYNTAGAAVAQITPGTAAGTTRLTKISYADVFNDNGNNRNTFAYPTTLTDAANNFSLIKYRFDIGANVWAKSPDPNTTTTGKTTTRTFDALGRLGRETVLNTGAYTHYEYPAVGTQSKVYTTINDTNGNGADADDEVLTESLTDGAGRVLRTRTAHPGSTGQWSATRTEYDLLGQVKRASVPTEVDANWQPAGDGAIRGWLWQEQEYDWKGRTTKMTETDGTFKTMSYDGCGCAGGEVVSIEGEQLADGKRKQRVYSDLLGRQYKTEILNWDGTVYSTNLTKFNGRDQADWNKQLVGEAYPADLLGDACPIQPANEAQSCQITKMTYDGHARLKTQHTPQQDADKAAVLNYYPNGELHTKTDARGAVSTYSYNERGLLTQIDSTLPAVGGSPSPTASNQLSAGQSLSPGQFITSPNGQYKLIYQTDGNFVLYDDISNSPLWGAQVTGSPGSAVMQTDGNFVVYNSSNTAVWHSNTNNGQSGSRLVVQDNGNTVLYRSDNSVAWETRTTRRVPLPSVNTTTAFGYDPLGNRLWMTDSLGRTDYQYDGLSRLKSETRKFVDTTQTGDPLVMAHAPLPNNSFKLQYTYGLGNQLTSLTDPFGAVVNYAYDHAGRLNNVTGSSFGSVTTYASGAEYQAWGGLKKLNYGSANSVQATMTYNDRLQADAYQLTGGGHDIMKKNYTYYADGALKYVQDMLDPKFDRLNIYDQVGRIKEGKTGLEARSNDTVAPSEQSASLPYRQSYEHNAFDNLTKRDNLHWGKNYWEGQSFNLNYSYKDKRIQGAGWQYDADGRNLQSAAPDDYASSTYDAVGQMTRSQTEQTDAGRFYDGNGREVKRATANFVETENSSNWIIQPLKYYIRSSVLSNEVVSEVWANGKKGKTFVNAAGSQIAYQSAYAGETASLNEAVFFEYSDASGMSQRTTDRLGAAVATGDGGDGSPVELDPMGGNVGTSDPYFELIGGGGYTPDQQYPMLQPYLFDQPFYVNGQQLSCAIDGITVGCGGAFSMLQSGAAALCPNNYCGPQVFMVNGQATLSSPFMAYGNGTSGYNVPRWENTGLTVDGIYTPGTPRISSWNFQASSSPNSIFWFPPQQTTQSTYYIPTSREISDRVGEKLSDKDCKDFLDKVRSTLGIDSTFQELLKDALSKGPEGNEGILYDKKLANQETSSLGEYNQIGLKPQPMDNISDPKIQKQYLSQRLDNYVYSVIHALIHRADVEGHSRFARAANGALLASERNANPLPERNKKEGKDAFDRRNSLYFQETLKKKCPGVVPKN